MLIAKASSQSREALNDAKAEYVNLMEMVCGPHASSLSIADLYAEHQRMKKKATDSYNQRPIMFSRDLSGASDLDRDMDEKYTQYFEQNRLKRENEEREREKKENEKKDNNALILGILTLAAKILVPEAAVVPT